MLPSHFVYIFVHLRQTARLRPELSPKFCQLWAQTRPEPGPNPNPTRKDRPNLQLCGGQK